MDVLLSHAMRLQVTATNLDLACSRSEDAFVKGVAAKATRPREMPRLCGPPQPLRQGSNLQGAAGSGDPLKYCETSEEAMASDSA